MHTKDFDTTEENQLKSSQGVTMYLIHETKTCLYFDSIE